MNIYLVHGCDLLLLFKLNEFDTSCFPEACFVHKIFILYNIFIKYLAILWYRNVIKLWMVFQLMQLFSNLIRIYLRVKWRQSEKSKSSKLNVKFGNQGILATQNGLNPPFSNVSFYHFPYVICCRQKKRLSFF